MEMRYSSILFDHTSVDTSFYMAGLHIGPLYLSISRRVSFTDIFNVYLTFDSSIRYELHAKYEHNQFDVKEEFALQAKPTGGPTYGRD